MNAAACPALLYRCLPSRRLAALGRYSARLSAPLRVRRLLWSSSRRLGDWQTCTRVQVQCVLYRCLPSRRLADSVTRRGGCSLSCAVVTGVVPGSVPELGVRVGAVPAVGSFIRPGRVPGSA